MLEARATQDELMDDPALDAATYTHVLHDLAQAVSHRRACLCIQTCKLLRNIVQPSDLLVAAHQAAEQVAGAVADPAVDVRQEIDEPVEHCVVPLEEPLDRCGDGLPAPVLHRGVREHLDEPPLHGVRIVDGRNVNEPVEHVMRRAHIARAEALQLPLRLPPQLPGPRPLAIPAHDCGVLQPNRPVFSTDERSCI